MTSTSEQRRRKTYAQVELLSEAADLKAQVETLELDRDEYAESLEDALRTVKYWMHDVMVLNKPMRDPRKILCVVEEALR